MAHSQIQATCAQRSTQVLEVHNTNAQKTERLFLSRIFKIQPEAKRRKIDGYVVNKNGDLSKCSPYSSEHSTATRILPCQKNFVCLLQDNEEVIVTVGKRDWVNTKDFQMCLIVNLLESLDSASSIVPEILSRRFSRQTSIMDTNTRVLRTHGFVNARQLLAVYKLIICGSTNTYGSTKTIERLRFTQQCWNMPPELVNGFCYVISGQYCTRGKTVWRQEPNDWLFLILCSKNVYK